MPMSDGFSFQDIAVEDAVFVAVMGITGSGKSNFVKLATGSDKEIVGNNLTSFTQNPMLLQAPRFGENVFLIDTPGFDDTHNTDAKVLIKIAECLQLMYNNKVKLKLRGIIYMHRIIDPRMTHGGLRNLKMFRQLCGPEPMPNIYLVTSFWDKEDPQIARGREEELRTKPEFWGEMLQEGAQMKRFENTQESAWALIEALSKKPQVALQLQHELCEKDLPLAQTKAGQQVYENLEEMAKKHAEEIQELQKQMQEALQDRDAKLEKILEREHAKSEKRLEIVQAQQAALQADFRNEARMREQELDRRLRRLQAERKKEVSAVRKSTPSPARHDEMPGQDEAALKKQKEEKKQKVIKYAKVTGGAALTAAQFASVILNPMAAPAALGSLVSLINTIMSGSGEAGAADSQNVSAPS